MEDQAKSSRSIQRPFPSSWVNSCELVGAGNGSSVPETSKPSLKDHVESRSVDPHRGDKGSVVTILVEAHPWCPNTGVGEQVHPRKVLSAGLSVFYQPCMILVGSHDEDGSGELSPFEELVFLNFELVLGDNVVQEEVVVVHEEESLTWPCQPARVSGVHIIFYLLEIVGTAARYLQINLG